MKLHIQFEEEVDISTGIKHLIDLTHVGPDEAFEGPDGPTTLYAMLEMVADIIGQQVARNHKDGWFAAIKAVTTSDIKMMMIASGAPPETVNRFAFTLAKLIRERAAHNVEALIIRRITPALESAYKRGFQDAVAAMGVELEKESSES